MSVPNPCAAGNSDNSASRIAPEPVPRSAMRNGRSRSPSARSSSSASSTTVSVSGRGTSVADESCSGRPQNSFSPRMRATGSPARRRRANSSRRADSSGVSWRCAADDQAGQVEAERMACQQPRVEFGGFDGGGFELRGERAPRGLDGLVGEIVMRRLAQISTSSLRTQGPIRRGLIDEGGVDRHFRNNERRWLWVPAFAGTTARLPLTPPRLGRQAARPGARWSARRSIRPALRPKSPAAICRASG